VLPVLAAVDASLSVHGTVRTDETDQLVRYIQRQGNMELAGSASAPGMTASSGSGGVKIYSSGRPLQVLRADQGTVFKM